MAQCIIMYFMFYVLVIYVCVFEIVFVKKMTSNVTKAGRPTHSVEKRHYSTSMNTKKII